MRIRADIESPRLLAVKGVLFAALGLGGTAGVVLLAGVGERTPLGIATLAALHGAAVWGFCRAYYFAFYVIEKYAGSGARYSGLIDAAGTTWRMLRQGRASAQPRGEPPSD